MVIIVLLGFILIINSIILVILIGNNRGKLNVRIIDIYQDDEKWKQELEGQLYRLRDYKIKEIKILQAESDDKNHKNVYIFYYH